MTKLEELEADLDAADAARDAAAIAAYACACDKTAHKAARDTFYATHAAWVAVGAAYQAELKKALKGTNK